MNQRAVRGAITVEKNTPKSIKNATKKLLGEIISKNEIRVDDICFILFSTTQDLDAVFPAKAAIDMGLNTVPLLDVSQMQVVESLQRCIRILLVFNTNKSLADINHVYLEKARELRPDF